MTPNYPRQNGVSYQMPPSVIANLADGPQFPTILLSPNKQWLIKAARPSLPGITDIILDELRLAGIRINPMTNGSSRSQYYSGLSLYNFQQKKELSIEGLPEKARIAHLSWSPNSAYIAFTLTYEDGLELWLIDLETRQARSLSQRLLNEAIGAFPYRWMPNSQQLLYKAILKDRGPAPAQSGIPHGPIILENSGEPAPIPNYQDLLKNTFDEALFAYYTHSQLFLIDIHQQRQSAIGKPGMITSFVPSPDGQYLYIRQLQQPFSYLVPHKRFAFQVLIYHQNGQLIREVANVPLIEHLPKGFSAVRTGPRFFQWRSDEAASLYWVEAQDGGDPNKSAEVRDRLFVLRAPFEGPPQKGMDYTLRFGGIIWGKGDLAITKEWWWANRKEITSIWQPDHPDQPRKVIFDRSWEDIYQAPGGFQTQLNASGHKQLLLSQDQKALYLFGSGASPQGNRPFVDRFDLETNHTQRLWQSTAPHYEVPKTFINEASGILLTCKESEKDPPNFYLRHITTGAHHQITHFEHPYKALIGIRKQLVQYHRKDGVELSGRLYLPPAYNSEKDGPLPVLMWAYPREFKSAEAAGQLNDSPHRFSHIGWWSPLFWLTRGYAIFDNFGMPIIGEGEAEPNETFIEQLIAGAEAAVKALVEMGVADPHRLAVGGHSYGAFMTANLLAHTDLFAAGIARSGAYNRTLTPFGFQLEERSFWEARETYFHMSPFMHADKIKAPLLLIHGQADNNAGTYPMQSERFYAALKGNGATVRLVMLPHESHTYQSRESIMHMLWEMTNWLDSKVKNRKVE
ncbi:MAG: prolyl oligopeptidase family serine peptidase [Bacteroidota bacterium]